MLSLRLTNAVFPLALIVIYEQVCKEKVIEKYRSLQRFTFKSRIPPERLLVSSQTCFPFYGGNLETGSLYLTGSRSISKIYATIAV